MPVDKRIEEAREAKVEESLMRQLCAEEVKHTLKLAPYTETAAKLAERGHGL